MNLHHTIVYFGYELIIPSDVPLGSFILMLHDLNHMMTEPFQIKAIMASFPEMMDECDIHPEMVKVVIGFSPLDMKELHQHLHALHDYVKETVLLDGMEIAEEARFFSGIEWIPEAEDESEDESEEESDEVSEDNDFSG